MNLKTIAKPVVDYAAAKYAVGTEEERLHAHRETAEEIRRYQEAQTALNSNLPELELDQLTFRKYGRVEDSEGRYYGLIRGVVDNPQRSSAVAWFTDQAGEICWLEKPASGPLSRAEFEAQEAEREARRTAPKQRPAWMDK